MDSQVKAMMKTLILVVLVAAAYGIIFAVQLESRIGPAGAMRHVPAGSPEWFEAAQRWVAIARYGVWPLLILAGAAAQRFWCPNLPVWTCTAVAVPAVIACSGLESSELLLCAGYVLLALLAGFVISRRRDIIAPPSGAAGR